MSEPAGRAHGNELMVEVVRKRLEEAERLGPKQVRKSLMTDPVWGRHFRKMYADEYIKRELED